MPLYFASSSPLPFSVLCAKFSTMDLPNHKAVLAQYRALYQEEEKAMEQDQKDADAALTRAATRKDNMKRLAVIIEGLEALTARRNVAVSGLYKDILDIFANEQDVELTPRQVKMRLEKKHGDLSKYNNPAAYVHVTLKRLVGMGRLRRRQLDDGSSVYRWADGAGKVEEIKIGA